MQTALDLLGVKSRLDVHSDSVYDCAETFSIVLDIPRAKTDAGASLQCVCRPMALPY
jgi:hypothetical protein